MKPIEALEILVSLLARTPMTPAEKAGAQACVDTLNKALAPAQPEEAAIAGAAGVASGQVLQ